MMKRQITFQSSIIYTHRHFLLLTEVNFVKPLKHSGYKVIKFILINMLNKVILQFMRNNMASKKGCSPFKRPYRNNFCTRGFCAKFLPADRRHHNWQTTFNNLHILSYNGACWLVWLVCVG